MSDREFDLQRIWGPVWARRGWVAVFAATATIITAVIVFLLPSWYRAEAVLLPPSDNDSGFGPASLLHAIAVPGISIPSPSTGAEVFIAILESRTVGEQVVREFNLQALYHKPTLEDAIRELSRHAKFKLTEAGTIVIGVEDHDAKRAAAMANRYVDLLDRFNREVRMTKGRRTRLFIETRITETQQKLSRAEEELAAYQSRHKTLAISPDKSSAIEAAADLYGQREALQIRLGVVRSYTRASTDEEVQIQQRLEQIDHQLALLPQTGLEQARLLREVKTLEQVFVLLSAQYEQAQIDEARDVATVESLDPASPPVRKSRPHRVVMILGAALLGTALGIAYALLQPGDRAEYPADLRVADSPGA